MLLEYLAKPPVVWRVLQLHSHSLHAHGPPPSVSMRPAPEETGEGVSRSAGGMAGPVGEGDGGGGEASSSLASVSQRHSFESSLQQLQHAGGDAAEATVGGRGGGEGGEGGQGREGGEGGEGGSATYFPCVRLLRCLLASVLKHLQFSSKMNEGANTLCDETRGGGGAGGTVVAKGCWEVLSVAWRLAYVHWSQVSQTTAADAAGERDVC